jgi:hypothetical protein
VLGDLPKGDGDPSLVLWGKQVTPNIHALASTFTNHDNFYDDSETSVQGHSWLTSNFVNDYMERTWFEDYRNHPGWGTEIAAPQGRPSYLTFFTHLLKHNIDFMIYGEIVGATDLYNAVPVAVGHSDLAYPGGPYSNMDVADTNKAAYVAQKLIDENKFPPFVYVLIPNDHTKGLASGQPTPESMISDNDYATGLLVDKISHSKYWTSTAIFIVEDDPQSGGDHVDYHRSICVIASPFARRAHTSSVHTSFPSLFRTFEKILGIPPMNRYDALATPFWDSFTRQSDPTPFTVWPRTVPDGKNLRHDKLARLAAEMDFSGLDRNPDLGDLLYWHVTGKPPAGARIGTLSVEQFRQLRRSESRDDDDDGDEQGKRRLQALMRAAGMVVPAGGRDDD